MTPTGVIYWNELNTWDVKKAMDYYGPIMGWTFDEVPSGDPDSPAPYYIAKKDQPKRSTAWPKAGHPKRNKKCKYG